jgi:hypothetical protein
VGEHHRAKAHAEDALLVNALCAHLHHRLAAPGVAHLREQTEGIQRLWSGEIGRDRPRPQIIVNRTDQPHPLSAGLPEEMPQQVRHRRFAPAARHTDHP